MVYVVLGMHKSGTTLVAEILHRSGIPMVEQVDEQHDYDSGNKWERRATAELNLRVLRAGTSDSLDLEPAPESRLAQPELVEEARRLAAGIAAATPQWGFKDPRTCLTWPLWERALERPTVIGVYRHHSAVLEHFLKHAGERHRAGRSWRSSVARKAMLRWVQHNERVARAVEGARGRALMVSYDRLMAGHAELDRLRAFLDRELVDPRDPGKFRNVASAGWRSRRVAWGLRLRGQGNPARVLARLEALREESLTAERA